MIPSNLKAFEEGSETMSKEVNVKTKKSLFEILKEKTKPVCV